MTTPTTSNNEAADSRTFETQVTEAIAAATKDSNGKMQLSEDLPESLAFAAHTELRRRETQASFTRAKQQQAILEAEKEELLKHSVGNVDLQLTDEQVEQLEDLKDEDPEKWRITMNRLESSAKEKRAEELNDKLKTVSGERVKSVELEQRAVVLQEFRANNPQVQIDDEVIANDIPPRITKKLENGTITFSEYLLEAKDYLLTGKTIAKGDESIGQANLGKAGDGSSTNDTNTNAKGAHGEYERCNF